MKLNRKYSVLAFNNFDSAKQDWVISGYSISEGRLSMSETSNAWNSKMVYWNKVSQQQYQHISARIVLNAKNTILRIGKYHGYWPTVFEVDFENDQMSFYKNTDPTTKHKTGDIGFTTQEGKNYFITLSKDSYSNPYVLTIGDGANSGTFEYSFSETANIPIGLMHGSPFISLNKGNIYVDRIEYSANHPIPGLKLSIIGDSIVDPSNAWTFGGFSYLSQHWAQKLNSDLNGMCSISGIPGEAEADMTTRIMVDIVPLKPKYAFIYDWPNANSFLTTKALYSTFINKCKMNNIIPIISTIQPYHLADEAEQYERNKMNDWVINISNERYVDVAYATSLNNDRITHNPAMHSVSDQIHFNLLGNNAIYDRIKKDAHYVFEKKYRS